MTSSVRSFISSKISPGSILSPLRQPVFRSLWTASLLSNLGMSYMLSKDLPKAEDALRQAMASGAAVIYLPHGTYAISDGIEIPSTVRMSMPRRARASCTVQTIRRTTRLSSRS